MGTMNAARLEDFLRHLRERAEPVSPYTIKSYRSKLRQFLTWLDGRPATPARLVEWRDHLRHEAVNCRGGVGQKPRTIKHAFTALAQFFAYLEEHHGMELPDPRRIKRPAVQRSDHGDSHVPTEDDISRIYAAVESWPAFTVAEKFTKARTLAMLALAIECALRRGELLGLHRTDLRTDTTPWTVTARKAKGAQHRTVPLNTRATEYARAYLDALQAWAAEVPARKKNPALWPRDRSRALDRAAVDTMRARVLAAAGLSHLRIRLHDFRHYRITAWGSVPGVNPASVQELAGHADLTSTLGYYHARQAEKLKAVAESAGGAPSPAARDRRPRLQRRPVRTARGAHI